MLCKSLKIIDRVEFIGWKDSMGVRRLYRSSSLTVVTGIYEPYAYGVLDPLALGCPVLVSGYSGLTDYLLNVERQSFTNVKTLSDGIRATLNASADDTFNMRVESMQHINSAFSIDSIVKQLEVLL